MAKREEDENNYYFYKNKDKSKQVQAVALYVEDGEEEPTGKPPNTAEEYLRQVRWEANRCPDIVVSKKTPSPFFTLTPLPLLLLPLLLLLHQRAELKLD